MLERRFLKQQMNYVRNGQNLSGNCRYWGQYLFGEKGCSAGMGSWECSICRVYKSNCVAMERLPFNNSADSKIALPHISFKTSLI